MILPVRVSRALVRCDTITPLMHYTSAHATVQYALMSQSGSHAFRVGCGGTRNNVVRALLISIFALCRSIIFANCTVRTTFCGARTWQTLDKKHGSHRMAAHWWVGCSKYNLVWSGASNRPAFLCDAASFAPVSPEKRPTLRTLLESTTSAQLQQKRIEQKGPRRLD